MAGGKVYLVGAGPGDPELITRKGLRVLRAADVVVYDRLANPLLLELCRPDAERIYAGKEASRPVLSQEEINELLVQHAAAGKTVCRLKGGDPFLFGRGGEEAEALVRAGIPWEYVPGVPSVPAVPAYAGIPVTHRDLSSFLTVATAHADGPLEEWASAPAGGTLVLLMGVERLEAVTRRLIELGRPDTTPAAVVSWGTRPEQRTVAGSLADVARLAAAAGLTAPAVLIVGDVVALRERLRWWDAGPLFGRRIVITRAREQSLDLRDTLLGRGAIPILSPAIRLAPLPLPDGWPGDRRYDWIVFTSANGIRFLRQGLEALERDLRMLGTGRIAAIGPETARAVREAGLHVDFVPTRYVAEGLLEEWPDKLQGARILLVRAREARDLLPDEWRRAGALVDVLPVYETGPDPAAREALEAAGGPVDAVTFASSSAVRCFLASVPRERIEGARVVCIGPITARTARELGLTVHRTAETYTVAGLIEALEAEFAPGTNQPTQPECSSPPH